MIQRITYLIPFLVGAVLLASALLKTYQLSTSPDESIYFWGSRTLTIVLVEFELLLATFLVAGIIPSIIKNVTFFLVCCFAVVSFAKASAGEVNCGCFGPIQVHPWITFAIDIVLCVLIVVWDPTQGGKESTASTATSGKYATLLTGLVVMAIAFWPMATFQTTTIDDDGNIVADHGVVILEPQNWTGKKIPVVKFIDNSTGIMDKQCKLVFYHEHCPECRELIQETNQTPPDMLTVFVEVPPHASPKRNDHDTVWWRKLSPAHQWYVKAPITITLDKGIVGEVITRNGN